MVCFMSGDAAQDAAPISSGLFSPGMLSLNWVARRVFSIGAWSYSAGARRLQNILGLPRLTQGHVSSVTTLRLHAPSSIRRAASRLAACSPEPRSDWLYFQPSTWFCLKIDCRSVIPPS